MNSMHKHYLHLIDYNDWANDRMIKSLIDNMISNDRILSIASHTIISQVLWLNRVKKEEYEYKDFWQKLNYAELSELSKRSTEDWRTFLTRQEEPDLEKLYSYVNSRGKQFENTLAQILTHVINHSTYHRAQAAALLRSENIDPPLTDYIVFCRE